MLVCSIANVFPAASLATPSTFWAFCGNQPGLPAKRPLFPPSKKKLHYSIVGSASGKMPEFESPSALPNGHRNI